VGRENEFWSVKDGRSPAARARNKTMATLFWIWRGGGPAQGFELRAMWRLEKSQLRIHIRSKDMGNSWSAASGRHGRQQYLHRHLL